MPKASSPVRLEADLMQAAAITGERAKRSAAEQIEYWAGLGRSIAKTIDHDTLLAVSTGLATLKAEPVTGKALDVDSVFDALHQSRNSGKLKEDIAGLASIVSTKTVSNALADHQTSANDVRYQASSNHAGYLEQLASDGTLTVGQFINGEFIPRR